MPSRWMLMLYFPRKVELAIVAKTGTHPSHSASSEWKLAPSIVTFNCLWACSQFGEILAVFFVGHAKAFSIELLLCTTSKLPLRTVNVDNIRHFSWPNLAVVPPDAMTVSGHGGIAQTRSLHFGSGS
jgi:hypothetical protein